MGYYVNDDLRKDIQKVLEKNHALHLEVGRNLFASMGAPNTIMLERNTNLVDDLEDLFEKWYDMRVSACLV